MKTALAFNELIGLLSRYDRTRLQRLRVHYPEHQPILEPGIIAGPAQEVDLVEVTVEVCIAGLEASIRLAGTATGRAVARLSIASTTGAVALGSLLGICVLQLLLPVTGRTDRAWALGLALLASLATAALVWCRRSERTTLGTMSRVALCQDASEGCRRARFLLASLYGWRRARVPGDRLADVVPRANTVARILHRLALEEGIIELPSSEPPLAGPGRLDRLFASLFPQREQLERFLRYIPDGDRVTQALPGRAASTDEYRLRAIEVLMSMGLVDGELFQRLRDGFPRRVGDIDATERVCLPMGTLRTLVLRSTPRQLL